MIGGGRNVVESGRVGASLESVQEVEVGFEEGDVGVEDLSDGRGFGLGRRGGGEVCHVGSVVADCCC